MKLAAICDKDTAVGLRLAGLNEIHVPEGKNVLKTWTHMSERDDIGVLFITEKIAEKLGDNLKDFRLRENIPIIIEIPDKKGKKKDHVDFVSHLIKKAVGVKLDK